MKTIANAVVAADKTLDAQFSQNNGVLLQVAGTMKLQVRGGRKGSTGVSCRCYSCAECEADTRLSCAALTGRGPQVRAGLLPGHPGEGLLRPERYAAHLRAGARPPADGERLCGRARRGHPSPRVRHGACAGELRRLI